MARTGIDESQTPRLTAARTGRETSRFAGGLEGICNLFRMQKDLLGLLRSLDEKHEGLSPIRFTVLGQPLYLFRDPKHVHQLLRDSDTFPRTQAFMRTFSATLGYSLVTIAQLDEWRSVRKRTLKHFAGKSLEVYGDIVSNALQQRMIPVLEERARRGQPVNVFDEMLDLASVAAFSSFLGDELDRVPAPVYQALNEIFSYVRSRTITLIPTPLWFPSPDNRRVRKNLALVHGYLAPRLRTDAQKSTMLGDTIRGHTREDGSLDELRALQEMTSNLVGASETTIVLMFWALYFIMQDARVEAAVVDEAQRVIGKRPPVTRDFAAMPYLDAVINETLRMRPPAFVTGRISAKDTALDGVMIEKNAIVLASQYVTHHSPALWKDPLEFRPERFLETAPARKGTGETSFFPFGGGMFLCIGMQFAVNEAKLMLASLLQRFTFRPVSSKDLSEVGMDANLTLRPAKTLNMTVHLREREGTAS